MTAPLDTHLLPESRTKLGATAWFCNDPPCEVAYFDQLGGLARVDELISPVYPKSEQAPICPCFHFTVEEIELDVDADVPQRIRDLLLKSQSPEARCGALAADGRCCLTNVRRLYLRLREQRGK